MPVAGTLAVKAEDLCVRSDDGNVLLSSLSFSAASGRVHVLGGASGSGKTVCARALCGLLPENLQVEGRLACDGAVYVGEDPDSQVVTLSAEDEVASALEFACVPADEIGERVREALRLVGLEGLEGRNPWTLSGGQRQRLALACALARRPCVLVLDEPCANIDPEGRRLVYRLLREQADRGAAVVLLENRQAPPAWADDFTLLPAPGGRTVEGALSRTLQQSASRRAAGHAIAMEGVCLGPEAKRLAGVDLKLLPGKTYLLAGPNGCGKTSLMAVLTGAVRPSGGCVKTDGRAVRRLPDGMVAWAQQNPERQFVQDTVAEEVARALAAAEPDGPLSREQLEGLPAALGLADAGAESPYALSAGRKRRLGVLLALLSNRPLVLLDEPTAGMGDAEALDEVLHVYARNGGTVVASSHDASLSSDVTVRMRAGRVTAVHATGEGADGTCPPTFTAAAEDSAGGTSALGNPAAGVAGPAAVSGECGSVEPAAHDGAPAPVASAGSEAPAPPAGRAYPPLNPVTVIGVVLWLVVLGALSPHPAVAVVLAGCCLVAAAAWHRSGRKLAVQAATTLLAAAAFALMALRSNWAGAAGVDWTAVAHHGALGAVLLAASLWAGTLVSVGQLADAASQRLRVPYAWCTLALCGTSIASFLANVQPLVSTAVRLRRVRLGAPFHNLRVRALLPVHSALPLFVESIRHAGRLHVTLLSRDFGRFPERTFRVSYPWRLRDAVAAALLAVLTVLTFSL